jgi:hypothetical protein
MSHKLCSFVAYNSFYFPSIISTYTSSSTSTLYKGNAKRIWARCYYLEIAITRSASTYDGRGAFVYTNCL